MIDEAWVEMTLDALRSDGKTMSNARLDWDAGDAVRCRARKFLRQKDKAGWFDAGGGFHLERIATWDMLKKRETTV